MKKLSTIILIGFSLFCSCVVIAQAKYLGPGHDPRIAAKDICHEKNCEEKIEAKE